MTTKFKYQNKVFSYNNICSYAITLAACKFGLSVKWLGLPEFKSRGLVPSKSITLGNLYQISDGTKSFVFNKTRLLDTPLQSIRLCANKAAFKYAALNAGLQVPKGKSFQPGETNKIIEFAENTGYPLVLKPLRGSMGKGVIVGIEDQQSLLAHVLATSGPILIEQYVTGSEKRLYILGGQVIAVIDRNPAQIQGDGTKTLQQLIEEYQQNRKRKKLPYVKDSEEISAELQKQHYGLNDILCQGKIVTLSSKLGRSSGGIVQSNLGHRYPEYYRLAQQLTHLLSGLDFYAVDLIQNQSGPHIIEVNTRPQISSMLYPDQGEEIDLPELYLQYLFGPLKTVNESFTFKPRQVQQTLDQNHKLQSVTIS